MGKKLYIDGNTGTASITDPDYPAVVNDPFQNLTAVYFHTSLPYLQFVNSLTITNSYWDGYTPPVATWPDGGSCGGC